MTNACRVEINSVDEEAELIGKTEAAQRFMVLVHYQKTNIT